MADTVIGALRVALGLDTASFDEGLDKSSKAVKSFGRDVTAVAAGIGLEKAIEKVVEQFTHLIKESINLADEMGKMSQKIGVPTEQLSGLTVAAKLADVDVNTLGKSMGHLAKEMADVASKGVGPAASAFQYLGISAKGLMDQSPDQVLGKIADAFAKLPDGANKTAVAIAIFGERVGKNLIPLLNSGSAGLREMMDTARQLGLIISTETGKQAEKFNDSLKLVSLSIQGVGLQVAAYFLPAMAHAAESMVEWIKTGNLVGKTAEIIVRAITFLADNAKVLGLVFGLVFGAQIVGVISSFGLAIVALGQAFLSAAIASTVLATRMLIMVGTVAIVGGAILALTGNLGAFEKAVEKITGSLDISSAGTMFKDILAGMGLDVSAFTKNITLSKDAANDFNKSMKELLAGKKFDPNAAAEAKKFGDEIAKIALKTREANGEFALLAPGLVETAIRLKMMDESFKGFDGTVGSLPAKVQLLNAQLMQLAIAQAADPFTKMTQSVNTLSMALGTNQLSFDNWSLGARKAIGSIGEQMTKLSDDIIGGWTQLTGELGKNNKTMFRLNQALAIVQATISTFAGATKALEIYGPTPLGFAAMAAAIAAGLARVAAIKSQKYTGAAAGGRFRVPGGSMGVDTKMVTMAMAPGEMVDVKPASQTTGGGTAAGILEIPSINAKDFFTGETVRHMVMSIDQWMRDGGTGVQFAKAK